MAWASTNKSNLISLYHHQNMQLGLFMTSTVLHTRNPSKHAKALTVYEINLLQILSLIFKCKTRTAPFVFHNLYTLKPPSKYSLRTGNLLSIPLKRTKFGRFSIYFRGSYLWNNILAQKTFICRLKEAIFSLNDATLYF